MGRIFAVLSVALVAVAIAPVQAFGINYVGAHWPRYSSVAQVSPTVLDRTPSDWKSPTSRAVGLWNNSSRVEMGYSNQGVGSCTATSGAITACVENLPSDRCGEARLWNNGDYHFTYPIVVGSGTWAGSTYCPNFKNHIMCHEIGHALGIHHSDKSDTCVHLVYVNNSQNRGSHDIQMLNGFIYGYYPEDNIDHRYFLHNPAYVREDHCYTRGECESPSEEKHRHRPLKIDHVIPMAVFPVSATILLEFSSADHIDVLMPSGAVLELRN